MAHRLHQLWRTGFAHLHALPASSGVLLLLQRPLSSLQKNSRRRQVRRSAFLVAMVPLTSVTTTPPLRQFDRWLSCCGYADPRVLVTPQAQMQHTLQKSLLTVRSKPWPTSRLLMRKCMFDASALREEVATVAGGPRFWAAANTTR